MKGNLMTEVEAVRALTQAFSAKIVPLSAFTGNLDALNAEMYADLDDAGHFDEPWWLDMEEH
jgi:hypothetical protein